MISGIYSITNPEGKVYIGMSKNIKQRWQSYKRTSNTSQGYIRESINKHGYDKHRFDVLERCGSADLYDKEVDFKRKFIAEYGWDKALFMKIYDLGKGVYNNNKRFKRISESRGGKEDMRKIFKTATLESYVDEVWFKRHFMYGDIEDMLY